METELAGAKQPVLGALQMAGPDGILARPGISESLMRAGYGGLAGRDPDCWALPAGAPMVSMPPRIHGYLHQPLLVSCSVHSTLPFRLQLRRDGARLGEERHFQ